METKSLWILKILNNSLLAYTLLSSILLIYLPHNATLFLYGFIFVLIMLFCELIQLKIRHFFLYALLHIFLVFASILLIQNYLVLIPFIILLSVLTILSFYGRIKELQFFYPDFKEFLFFILIYIIGHYLENHMICVLSTIAEIICCFLCILYVNIKQVSSFFHDTKESVEIPYAKIRKTNSILLFFSFFMTGFGILMSFILDPQNHLIALVKNILLLLLHTLVQLITWLLPDASATVSEVNTASSLPASPPSLNTVESSPFWDLFFHILTIACLIVGIPAILFLLYKAILHFINVFQSASLESFHDSICSGDIHETAIGKQHIKKKQRSPLFLSPNAKIRRYYIHFLTNFPDHKKIISSYTPSEMEQTVVLQEDFPSLTHVHELYEEARYSNHSCTSKEVKEMKQHIKNKKSSYISET